MLKPVTRKRGRASKLPVPASWTTGRIRRIDPYYITDTFNRRECSKYVADNSDSQKRCKCGQTDDEHSDNARKWVHSHTATWDPLVNTTTLPTNAYGEINFMAAENDILPLYLRCDIKTDVADLGTLLLRKWCLPDPNLLISVFGGHSKFDSKVIAAEAEIKEGLINAAKSTKAWLFTSGVDHGVSNMVGDAVAMKRSFISSIPVIGVNSWGAVANNHQLVDKQGLFPAHYNSERSGLKRDAAHKPISMALEHEHTHFILLDGGTKFNFHENEVRKFRIHLQQEVVRRTGAQLVSVMVEGGSGSLDEARLRVGSGLPLIILADSGRVADVLCAAYDMAIVTSLVDGAGVREVRQLENEDDRQKVRDSLTTVLPGFSETCYDDMVECVEEIIAQDHLVTIWRSGRGEELDKSILKGLIKSLASVTNQLETADETANQAGTIARELQEKKHLGKETLKRQLELAIQWDRLDIAEEYIFNNMILKQEDEINELLGLAIRHKKVSFIRNILERHANIKSFLTVDVFEEMLRQIPRNLLLYNLLLKKCDDPKLWRFEHFAEVVQTISEGVFSSPGKSKSHPSQSGSVANDIHEVRVSVPGNGDTALLMDIHEEKVLETNGNDVTSHPQQLNKYDFEDPENLLTMFLAMTHEQEMAKVFWEHSPTPLFLGIVCSCIHKWMKSREKVSLHITNEMAIILAGYAEEFEGLSRAIIDQAGEYPAEYVVELINMRSTSWSRLTALEMADYSDSISIIAHNSVQCHIDAQWTGWLDPDISNLRIFVSLFCPLLASFRDVTPRDKQKWKDIDVSEGDDATETVRSPSKKCRRAAFVNRGKVDHEVDLNEKLPLLTKCKYFYKAPVTKFYIYMSVYMFFLFSFVSALLIEDQLKESSCFDRTFTFRTLSGCRLSLSEQFVYLWVFCSIPLEIRQIYFSYPTSVLGKLKIYISNTYNKNDVGCMLIVLVALFFKFRAGTYIHPGGGEDYDAYAGNTYRLFFSLAFALYAMRICQALQIDETLGPKVMMMQKMLVDLTFFIWLVAIFLIGYGVSTTAILNPNKQKNYTSELVFGVFWRPYVNLFGEFNDDYIVETMNEQYCIYEYGEDAEQCSEEYTCEGDTDGAHRDICVFNQYIVKIFLAVYMMLAAVLMLNLLVAVFSSTYQNIEDKSAILWKRQKFDLMMEFKSRSPLPIPVNTFLHCYRFLKLVVRRTCGVKLGCCTEEDGSSADGPHIDEHDRVRMSLLEAECRRNYLDKQKIQSEQEVMQADVRKLLSNVEYVDKRLKNFESSIQKVIDIQSSSVQAPQKFTEKPEYMPSQTADRTESSNSNYRKSYLNSEIEDDGGEEYLDLEEVDVDDILQDLMVTEGMATVEMSSMDRPPLTKTPSSTRLTRDDSDVSSKRGNMPTSNANPHPVDVVRLGEIAKRSRKPEYPGNAGIRRVFLKRDHWDWDHPLLNYSPVRYDDAPNPDKKLTLIAWNDVVYGEEDEEKEERDDRRSYEGWYLVRNKLPLNPCGRTGLSGRGKLPKYGPNHLTLPIFTRIAVGEDHKDGNRNVLEVMMMECLEEEALRLPEITCHRDTPITPEIKELFCIENITSDQEKVMRRISKILLSGIMIYQGFLDSEYNTDNSWQEATVVSYHDANDNAFPSVTFPETSPYRWHKVQSWNQIKSIHRDYLKKAVYARSGHDPPSSITE